MRKMMNKIQNLVRWGKMMNLDGWWPQYPKRASIAWRVFGRCKWRVTKWWNQDGGMRQNRFSEWHMKDGTAELSVLAVVKHYTDTTAATPSQTSFGEHVQTLDFVPRRFQMLQGNCCAGSSHMRLGSEKPHLLKCISSLPPVVAPYLSQIKKSNLFKPGSLYLCI